MKNKEEPTTINLFQWLMWLICTSITLLGIYFSLATGSLVWILFTAFGFGLFWTGIDSLPAKPITYGAVTIFGKRTNLYVKEGLYLLPKILALNLIKVEVRIADVDFEISVTTSDGIRVKGVVSISFRPNKSKFGDFLDVGDYDGAKQQLKGICELAGQKAVEGKPLQEVEIRLSELSEKTSDIIKGVTDPDNRNNDIDGLGIIVTKVQVNIIPPEEMTKAREARLNTKELMRGVTQQVEDTLELARILQSQATGVPCTEGTPIKEEFYKEAKESVQLALKQTRQTTVKGGKAVVVTDGKGSE